MLLLKKKIFKFVVVAIILNAAISGFVTARQSKTPETILPEKMIKIILNEVSGQLPFNNEVMMAGYNHIRPEEEWNSFFYEAQYLVKKLREYGLDEVKLEDLGKHEKGGTLWAREDAELWMIEPEEKRLSRLCEHPALMSRFCDEGEWQGEAVYIDGRDIRKLEEMDFSGKIIVTPEHLGRLTPAFQKGALGIISYHSVGKSFYDPFQVSFSMRMRKGRIKNKVFGFQVWAHLGEQLKNLIFSGQKVVLRATAKTKNYPYKLDTIFACIKGREPEKKGFMFTAHLFERPVKQGANDNVSGCVTLAEAARTIMTLIKEGKIERPERSIYFLMGEEGNSTMEFFKRNPGMADKILGVINMDMVGENLDENFAFFHIQKPPYSKASFIGTVAVNFANYVYETNMEKFSNHLSAPWVSFPVPIVEKNGSKQPFKFIVDSYQGASDHAMFIESDAAIPALMFGIWPDLWLHTDKDRPDKSDPTQLKRAAFIGITSALSICSGSEEILKNLIRETYSDKLSFIREALSLSIKELSLLRKNDGGKTFADAVNYVEQSIELSKKALSDIRELTRGKERITTYLNKIIADISDSLPYYKKKLQNYYENVAALNGFKPEYSKPSPEEEKLKKIIPVKVKPDTLGERFPYSAIFKAVRNERAIFMKYGFDCVYELWYSMNGERDLDLIRKLLSFEFKPMAAADLMKIVNNFKEAKLIKLVDK